jgi:hypothetical protein
LAAPGNTAVPVLFALKIIGLYRQPDDVELCLSAVRAPLEPDAYWWAPAFRAFTFESAYAQAPRWQRCLFGPIRPSPMEHDRGVDTYGSGGPLRAL